MIDDLKLICQDAGMTKSIRVVRVCQKGKIKTHVKKEYKILTNGSKHACNVNYKNKYI